MLLDKEKIMKEPLEENKIALGAAFGVVFGVVFGIIIGAAMDNVGLGIALGIALGAALGSTMQKEDSSSAEKWKISITKKRNYYKGKKWN